MRFSLFSLDDDLVRKRRGEEGDGMEREKKSDGARQGRVRRKK